MATEKFLKKLLKVSPIDILGEKYHLVFHTKRWLAEGSPGTVNFPHEKIYIDISMENNRILSILLHELMEIINDRYSLELPHTTICIITEGLMSIFRDNSDFSSIMDSFSFDCSGNDYAFEDFEETKKLQIEETQTGTKISETKKLREEKKKE